MYLLLQTAKIRITLSLQPPATGHHTYDQLHSTVDKPTCFIVNWHPRFYSLALVLILHTTRWWSGGRLVFPGEKDIPAWNCEEQQMWRQFWDVIMRRWRLKCHGLGWCRLKVKTHSKWTLDGTVPGSRLKNTWQKNTVSADIHLLGVDPLDSVWSPMPGTPDGGVVGHCLQWPTCHRPVDVAKSAC